MRSRTSTWPVTAGPRARAADRDSAGADVEVCRGEVVEMNVLIRRVPGQPNPDPTVTVPVRLEGVTRPHAGLVEQVQQLTVGLQLFTDSAQHDGPPVCGSRLLQGHQRQLELRSRFTADLGEPRDRVAVGRLDRVVE